MLADDAMLFVAVAETLSFKKAAEQLQTSRSRVSKRVALMERQLGTTLLYRSPRSISLTATGEVLLSYCRQICDLTERAKAAVEELNNLPSGRLRFSIPTCLGAALLPAVAAEFRVRYPHVVLDAHTSESYVDVVAGGYDVAIRVARKLTDSTLTAQRLATSPLVLAASPSYLDARGVPAHVSELAKHSCIGLRCNTQNRAVWQFNAPEGPFNVAVTLSASTDTNLALILAACSGLGFVYVPEAVIANELERGALVSVLPEFCRGVEWGVFAVYCGRTPTASARALIKLVCEYLPKLPSFDRWAAGPDREALAERAAPRAGEPLGNLN